MWKIAKEKTSMSKKTNKTNGFILCLVAFIFGIVASFGVFTYINLPKTEELVVSKDVYYSKDGEINKADSTLDISDADISVHFLELGNKYTGDCTYIKTKTCDILIDCGSKSDSIATVSNYLNRYVTDGKLEYVIVTHAHQDHYAGFATSETMNSIFDIFKCETVITFAKTNQKESATLYKNFQRELNETKTKNGTKVVTALDCVNSSNGASPEFNIGENSKLKILDSKFYTEKSTTENNYSVCSLVESNGKNFLFTGDLEKDGEASLVSLNTLPQVDLYKAGHHGSKTSSSLTLLEKIMPKTICVCCCAGSPEYTKTKDNQFPTQEFISNCAKLNITEIYVTTLCVDYSANKFQSFNGNIVYMATATTYNVQCSNNNTILKDSDWFKQNRVWETS